MSAAVDTRPGAQTPTGLPAVGDRIGPWALVAQERAGVFEGSDALAGRHADVRVLGDHGPRLPEWLARVAGVRELGLRPVLSAGWETGAFGWWAMPMPDRPTLADRIRQGPIARADAFHLAAGLADRLAVAHRAGIVLGALELADVGAAVAEAPTIPVWTGAPLDGSVDPRVDAVRLGQLWYTALTRVPPMAATASAETDLSLVRLLDLDPLVADEVLSLLGALLAYDPRRRPWPLDPVAATLRDLAAASGFEDDWALPRGVGLA